MLLKTEMKVAQYYAVFNYGLPRPQNNINYQDITIVEGTGDNLAPNFFLLGNNKEKVGKEIPPYALLVDNLETFWPPQWIRLAVTQEGLLWRDSLIVENQQFLFIRYIIWM